MTANPASILDSIKKGLGLDADDTSFDIDVIMHVNSALGILRQIGVGNDAGYVIEDNSALWTDYSSDLTALALLKSYILLKVRLWFDPPQNAKVIDSTERQIVELESRLNMMAERISPPSEPDGSPSQLYWWDLTGGLAFPPEAVLGDIGLDTTTGDVWANGRAIGEIFDDGLIIIGRPIEEGLLDIEAAAEILFEGDLTGEVE